MSDPQKDYPGWKPEPGWQLAAASCDACGKMQAPELLWNGKTLWLCPDADNHRLPKLGCMRLMFRKRHAARAEFEQWCNDQALPDLIQVINGRIGEGWWRIKGQRRFAS